MYVIVCRLRNIHADRKLFADFRLFISEGDFKSVSLKRHRPMPSLSKAH